MSIEFKTGHDKVLQNLFLRMPGYCPAYNKKAELLKKLGYCDNKHQCQALYTSFTNK